MHSLTAARSRARSSKPVRLEKIDSFLSRNRRELHTGRNAGIGRKASAGAAWRAIRRNFEAHTNRTQAACDKASTLIAKELTMTTKILTVRVPGPLYSSLCQAAGELGVPISAHCWRRPKFDPLVRLVPTEK
jgi:hypothetical protein